MLLAYMFLAEVALRTIARAYFAALSRVCAVGGIKAFSSLEYELLNV